MATINGNRIFWHVLLWGGVWFLLILYIANGFGNVKFLLYGGLRVFVTVAVVLIVNLKFLLPRFYFKNRIGSYLVLCLLLFIVMIWLFSNNFFLFSELNEEAANLMDMVRKREIFNEKLNRPGSERWVRFTVPLLVSFVGSTMIELTRFANKKEKTIISIEKEKLDTEIKYLKSQINPHFLFNVLNNIYSLTVIKSDKAPDNLLRLSGMLRYMLYDSNEEKVTLGKEIDYLKNYILLAELKDSRGMKINVDMDNCQTNLKVAPLLFIPFVENAFKHSKIEDLENGFINIKMTSNGSQLDFKIDNSIPNCSISKDDVGGIGLVNTRQRLNLLYPNKHTLDISADKNTFLAHLKIDLDE